MNTTVSSFENDLRVVNSKNKGNLPEYIIYLEIYDFTNRKKIFSFDNQMYYSDLNQREIELECKNKILKILSKKINKEKFIYFDSKHKDLKWVFNINKKNIGICSLFIEKEKKQLIENYITSIQKLFENYDEADTDAEIKFKNINKIIQKSENPIKDVNYAIQKMEMMVNKAEATHEQLGRIDENVKELKEDADVFKKNGKGIQQESEKKNYKLYIFLVVVVFIFLIGLGIFLYFKYKKNSVDLDHQSGSSDNKVII